MSHRTEAIIIVVLIIVLICIISPKTMALIGIAVITSYLIRIAIERMVFNGIETATEKNVILSVAAGIGGYAVGKFSATILEWYEWI